jgi:hypothetical protein
MALSAVEWHGQWVVVDDDSDIVAGPFKTKAEAEVYIAEQEEVR